MPIDLISETLWQEEPNSVWFSNVRQVCDLCGKKVDSVIEFKVSEEDEGTRVCFPGDRDCMRETMHLLFAQNPDVEFLWSRQIVYKPLGKGANKKGTVQREPIGLSKRYAVMKRDGFQCTLCGASGNDAKLEIDHITPSGSGRYGCHD